MSVKIVHCADIHIGLRGGDKQYAVRRRGEVLQTFLRAVSYAKEQRADLFLISGDLFDSHKVSGETLTLISRAFADFSGRVFIAPGNHDYYGENTFWESWELPRNVTVFRGDEVIEDKEIGVRIYGYAFEGAYKQSLELKKAENDDMINIAVVHGDTGADSLYAPVSETAIKESKMDYVALGHIHKRSGILKSGDTYYAYCGCIEGQGFDETGEKGVYAGTVEKGKVSLEFVPLCSRRFIEEHMDISGISSKSELYSRILCKIKEKYGDEGADWLYKIVLTGETVLNIVSADVAAALENDLYFVKVKDKTRIPLDILKNSFEESSVQGIFIKKLLDKRENATEEELENALRLGLGSFNEGVALFED